MKEERGQWCSGAGPVPNGFGLIPLSPPSQVRFCQEVFFFFFNERREDKPTVLAACGFVKAS